MYFIYSIEYSGFFGLVIFIFIASIISFISEYDISNESKIMRLEEYDNSKKLDNLLKEMDLSKKYDIFILLKDEQVAYSSGLSKIYLSEGILENKSEEIKAILSHEIGHLKNYDSYNTMFIIGSGILNVVFYILFSLGYHLSFIMLSKNYNINRRFKFDLVLIIAISLLFMIYLLLGLLIDKKNLKRKERCADKYVVHKGYKNGLISFLEYIIGIINLNDGDMELIEDMYRRIDEIKRLS